MNKQHERLESRSKKPASESAPNSASSSEGKEISAEQPEVPAEVLQKADETRIVSVSRAFSGPLPPPDVLRQYDKSVPGSAERIMKIAETGIAFSRNERKMGSTAALV